MFFGLLWIFFLNQLFQKIFQEYHQSVKQFGSRQNVGPDLGPNCLQGYQQMTKIATSEERVKYVSNDCPQYVVMEK